MRLSPLWRQAAALPRAPHQLGRWTAYVAPPSLGHGTALGRKRHPRAPHAKEAGKRPRACRPPLTRPTSARRRARRRYFKPAVSASSASSRYSFIGSGPKSSSSSTCQHSVFGSPSISSATNTGSTPALRWAV